MTSPDVRLASVRLAVPDAPRAARFYARALDFVEGPARPNAAAGSCTLALGGMTIELDTVGGEAGAIVPPVASDDPTFAHLAIVTSEIDAAFARVVAAGATPVSPRPQRIPDDNAASAGVRAAYLRDPDGHPFELISFPPGKGDARWQETTWRLVLGIDHLARVTTDTERALHFYRDTLGFTVEAESLNEGVEQECLAWVPGARVRVTSLRQRGAALGVELLEYLAPRRRPGAGIARDAPFLTELFETRDLPRAMRTLATFGYTCESTREGAIAEARDADGHTIEIGVEAARP